MSPGKQIEPLNSDLFTSLSIDELEERLAMEELDVRGEAWTCDCEGAATEGRAPRGVATLVPIIFAGGGCDEYCRQRCKSKW